MTAKTAATIKDKLHKRIEEMDNNQLRLLDAFLKELFDLDD